MRRVVAVLAFATAGSISCYRDPGHCEVACLDEGLCPSDMSCGSDHRCHLSDRPACNETADGHVGGGTCFTPHLDGFAATETICVTPSSKEFPADYDTTTCVDGELYEQPGGRVACIVAFTVDIAVNTVVHGDHPLVIVAPSMHVAGVEASSGKSANGPGARLQSCHGGAGLPHNMGGGGAAGGAGQGTGGGGGNSTFVTGSAMSDHYSPMQLEAGCGGGDGGDGEVAALPTNQGLGGGAVYLIAPAMSVTGKIIANGGGGQSSTSNHGGGGGGAGGMIVLEASVMQVQGYIIANGGGGSAGNNNDMAETSAPETPPNGAPSFGGMGSDPNAFGGASSGVTAVYAIDGKEGGDSTSSCGGGGGGGGAGYIILIHPLAMPLMQVTNAYPPYLERVY